MLSKCPIYRTSLTFTVKKEPSISYEEIVWSGWHKSGCIMACNVSLKNIYILYVYWWTNLQCHCTNTHRMSVGNELVNDVQEGELQLK